MKIFYRPKAGLKALSIISGLFLLIISSGINLYAQSPSAGFTPSVVVGCSPLTVDFTNTSTQANSYFWNFGNGNTSTLVNPTTVYVNPGTYTVTLVAINTISGQRDTLVESDLIFVPSNPVSDFNAPVVAGCVNNNSFSFVNLSAGAVSYVWDFGDGGFSTQANPVHTYTSPGTYTVKLIAENSYGCTNVKTETAYITIFPAPVAAFNVNQQSSCDQNQQFIFTSTGTGGVSWYWDFGDGNTSALQNPSHTYGAQGSFTVTHIVTNSSGCSDTIVQQAFINIGATLVPTFTIDNQSGCAPFDVQFSSTVSGATSWLWDFGDGTASSLESPSHTYLTPGNYDITLTVTTASGCNGSVTVPASVSVEQPPVAQFTFNTNGSCSPVVVDITNTSANANAYFWDFGNGITSADANPQIVLTDTGSYSVTLIAFSAGGCSDTLTQTGIIQVNDIAGSFSATPRIGCAPLPVDFTGNSIPVASSWFWDFGDGTTSVLQSPSHTFSNLGQYTITLVVTSAEGCIDTVTKTSYINVVTDSTSYTVPDTIIVCTPPGSVSFTDPTIGSNSWFWDFGDGGSSTVSDPTYNYTTAGIYTVTLNTTMAGGCTQTIDPFAIINVLEFDTLPIISSLVSLCGPFTVQLENNTPNVASFFWDFGDGDTSTLQNPVHTYTDQGTYTITLTLVGTNGCTIQLSTTVTFGHDQPVSVSNSDACQGDSIQFVLSPSTAFTSAVWDFGDGGNSNLMQPSHLYNNEGLYHVTVTVTDTNGCVFTYEGPDSILISNPIPSFTVNQATEGCIPFNVQFVNTSQNVNSFIWSFGDGGTDSNSDPLYSYVTAGVYSVTLTGIKNGCSRDFTLTDLITANEAVADFSFTPSTGCLPLAVSFTDLSINAVSWSWDFGDGLSSTVQNPLHTYLTDPNSDIRLIITDINGCIDTIIKPNVSPVIPEIAADDSTGCNPFTVSFSTPTAAATYIWDFGDGSTSSNQNDSHTYLQSGLYTVALTCILSSGCTTQTVMPDFINVIQPVSDFMSPTVSVCAPSLVDFVNQSTGATSWLWDFGDGTTSTNENPSHIYNIPGAYTITLISFTPEGCSDTITKIDYIVVPGTYSDFTLGSAINCLNTLVQFIDQSINATSWFWDFGDGFTSTLQNPVHLYGDTGSYTVTLITSDSTGCSSFISGSNPVTIYPIPDADASVSNTVGCQPLTTLFTNNSSGSVSYLWHFGNGDSSSVAITSYTFNNAGTYTPYLVAYNSAGCTDTISFPNGIVVNPVPDASFTLNNGSGCMPLDIMFTNTSGNLSTPSYYWDFGNGTTSVLESPQVTFPDSGSFIVTHIVTNTEGCSDTATTAINVFETPEAIGQFLTGSGCAPLEVTFINQSVNYNSLVWDFGDGTTSSGDTITHIYNNPGSYSPSLIVSAGSGCSDTLMFTTPVDVHDVPQAQFTVSQNAGCSGTVFSLINQSQPAASLNYSWNIGGQVYTTESPDVVLNDPGFYSAILIVTNQYGCTDTLEQVNFIEVYDTLPPPISPIVSVSVLNNSDVEITWLNSSALDLGAYVLYRKDNTTGIFNEIYRDTTPMNSVLNVTSVYTDSGLNTLQNTYTYKLQTLDQCAYTLPLAISVAHTTINITAISAGNNINVNWSEYKGATVGSYELNRVNLITGTSTFLAALPASVLTYTDSGFPCPHEYSYRVTATELGATTFSSNSDTSNAIPSNILANQKVEVVRSTVINDKDVLTEWLPPVLAPERVKEYAVFRSVDNISFSLIATVGPAASSYIDQNALVHDGEYYYKIEVISDCDVNGAPSNNSSSIWLQSEHQNDITRLWWTPYSEWDNGVDNYLIERQNWSGQWEVIRQVPGTQLEIEFDD